MLTRTLRRIISLLVVSGLWLSPCQAREITDMRGRLVTVPDVIQRVFSTSPPGTFMVYALDPGLLAGLNLPLKEPDLHYVDPRARSLPVLGGWMGQGRTPNLETLLQVRPDILVNWSRGRGAADSTLEQTVKSLGFPVVHIVLDSLTDYPAAFRFLGKLLDREERAAALCGYAQQALEEVASVVADIPAEERVSVYYAEGPDGLSSECSNSVHAELIPLSGAKNVHDCVDESILGLQKLSIEQVMRYNPEVIVTHEAAFFDKIDTEPTWKTIRAVRDHRVYLIPTTPLNWFDRPPSFMRLLGLKWLMSQLYPNRTRIDMAAETKKAFSLFWNVSLDDETIREILEPRSVSGRK